MTTDPSWMGIDAAHCWHPYTQHGVDPAPLPVVSAKGSWLELADGSRMLDAISSWWCCLHGHGHPALIEALRIQAETLDHVLFAGCSHEPAAALALSLVKRAPAGLSRVFFSDNGSTAVEVALKATYAHFVRRGETDRRAFIALQGGYHGDTVGAMSVGDPDPFFANFQGMLFPVTRIEPDADMLTAVVDGMGNRTAGIIVEPVVQGANGMTAVSDEFLCTARALCDRFGIKLIADEVFTGFGRAGAFFACDRARVSPDALCMSKALTSGMMPLAATLFREDMYHSFVSDDREQMFFHGHTFTANPLACAVARASLDLFEQNDTLKRLNAIGTRLSKLLAPYKDSPHHDLRHFGNIVAIEVLTDDDGYLSMLGDTLRANCLERSKDVLLRPIGNVIYAVPPASTTTGECDLIAKRMGEVLAI